MTSSLKRQHQNPRNRSFNSEKVRLQLREIEVSIPKKSDIDSEKVSFYYVLVIIDHHS